MDELAEVFKADFDDFFCVRHDKESFGCEDGEDLNKGIVMIISGVNLLMGAAHMDNVLFGFLQSAVVLQTVDDGFFIAFIRIKMCCLDQVIFAGIKFAVQCTLLDHDISIIFLWLEHPYMGNLMKQALGMYFLAGGTSNVVQILIVNFKNVVSSIHINSGLLN